MAELRLKQRSDTPAAVASNVVLFTDTDGNLNLRKPDGSILELAAAGNFTFTIPASGTPAMRNTVNTFTEAQTFNSVLTAPGMKPASNSTNALEFENAGGTPILTVDTTNSKVNVAALQVAGTDVPFTSGTWTPALTFGGGSTGITYTQALGAWRRNGPVVFFTADIRLSSKGTDTGNATVTGLPVASSGSALISQFTVRWFQMASSLVVVQANVAASNSNILLYGATAATTGAGLLTDTAFANNSILQLSGFYFAA